MINGIFHQRSTKCDLIKFLLNGAYCVSGEKTITLMTAWEERPAASERPLAVRERGAKSVGGLGNEGMIFCPVIATVPVTQLDLIGWFCVRCWCSSSGGGGVGRCDSAGREFTQFICLTAFIFWRARSKKIARLQLRSPSGANGHNSSGFVSLFSRNSRSSSPGEKCAAPSDRPMDRPKISLLCGVCVRGGESSPELK
jgi:hypothetical protein